MERIDKFLVNKGLFDSRSKAQQAVFHGFIYCNGEKILKNSFMVNEKDKIEIDAVENTYVSRAGIKLEKALLNFNIDISGKRAMDVGASKGGFTDCLLRSGAKEVVTVDVGTNQIDKNLKENERVVVHEGLDFRELDTQCLMGIDLMTMDVSFISVRLMIDKIAESKISEIICLIKPQFECGKELADKHKGIVLDKKVHINVINRIVEDFAKRGVYLVDIMVSPVRGKNGNIEYIGYFKRFKNNYSVDIESVVRFAFNKSM